VLLLCGLLSGLAPAARADEDQLSQEDHDNLIYHLNIIANDPGWPQGSVNAANAILSNPEYTVVAWDTFFTEYFTDYPFTDPLFNYIGYPVFYWFDEATHYRLQTGMHAPLMLANVDPGWAAAIAGPDDIFADDSVLRHDLHNSERMLTMIGASAAVSPLTRLAIFDHVSALIDQYPDVLRKTATFDRESQPYFGMLRAQTDMVLLASAPSLDFATRQQIADTLDLTGVFLDLWMDFTCLLLDNNLTDGPQRQFVYDYLNLVPTQLHNLRSITVNELLGNCTPYQDGTYDIRRSSAHGGVNIFGCPIGTYSENSFPPDVLPGVVDGYCVVVAHEVNHVVDAYAVWPDAVLGPRRDALIAAAGNAHMNYLRSMFADGFFVENPQEFFASIANQWFTDSAKTIELGLVRFDAGWLEPINQALFFAEVYSTGTNTTLFYTLDAAGALARQVVPVGRDAGGHINELAYDGQRYSFTLDEDGDVTAYTVAPVCLGDLDGDNDVDLADLARLLSNYGSGGGMTYEDGDLDGDGDIDLTDLAALLAVYGAPCA
jgi:hypothetical protein